MDIKQLLTVGDSTSPSSSQLWFHLTNIVILSVYLFIGFKVGLLIKEGVANAPQLIDSIMWLTGVISGIITGNKFANVIAKLKWGPKNDKSVT
jgi:hypothetical protein